MYNRGTKYLNKNNYSKALQFLKKEPLEFKEKYLNIGNCYRGLGDLPKAVENYLLANDSSIPFADGKRAPAYDLALNNLGMVCYGAGDDQTAIELYERALSINPVYYEALWNYASAYMRTGFSGLEINWAKGWALYEYRFKRASGAVVVEAYLPRWDGTSSGSTIVVLTEQGLGDKIMFGRYLPLLREYFSRVVVQCHPSLDCIYSDYEICRSSLEHLDAQSIPLASLAEVFFEKHPAHNWLDNKFTALGLSHERKNIGVVWSGSTTHANNANRSCPANYFSDLGSFGNLYSLNPAARAAKNVIPYTGNDWSKTAALVLALDIVVTVDTSIVHLCGTLGVPCIMIQPLQETDFRWGNGTTTYWYPSVTIVKNDNSWDKAFVEVRTLLKEKLNVQNN